MTAIRVALEAATQAEGEFAGRNVFARLWRPRFAKACVESASRGRSDGTLQFGRHER
jgi:hypothetical protein